MSVHKIYLFILILIVSGNSCSNITTTDKQPSLQEIRLEGQPLDVADIVRNPVSKNKPLDTLHVAKMTFEEARYDFGEVEAGAIITHQFTFRNTGKAPLLISDARSTCGCTVPEFPEKPIPVGEKSAIFVKFDTKDKENYQNKPIFITANTYPAENTVYLTGFVNASKTDFKTVSKEISDNN